MKDVDGRKQLDPDHASEMLAWSDGRGPTNGTSPPNFATGSAGGNWPLVSFPGGEMTSEDEAQRLFQELMKPVLSEGERTMILLQMGRAAYTVWALDAGITPDWDALPMTKKNSWVKVARISVRTMLSLVGRIWEGEV